MFFSLWQEEPGGISFMPVSSLRRHRSSPCSYCLMVPLRKKTTHGGLSIVSMGFLSQAWEIPCLREPNHARKRPKPITSGIKQRVLFYPSGGGGVRLRDPWQSTYAYGIHGSSCVCGCSAGTSSASLTPPYLVDEKRFACRQANIRSIHDKHSAVNRIF